MTSSSQCHNNPVFVPPRKPPNPVKDLYDGQIFDLKTRVDIWTRMDVVSAGLEKSKTFYKSKSKSKMPESKLNRSKSKVIEK